MHIKPQVEITDFQIHQKKQIQDGKEVKVLKKIVDFQHQKREIIL